MRTKKALIALIITASFLFAGAASAQIGMMNTYGADATEIAAQSQELNEVLQDIYASQNITTKEELDCSRVTEDQFEELGDAYMGIMIPNEEQHEAMDAMMGGEGSASLRQIHVNMGRSYLSCWSGEAGTAGYMPMMGGFGMMGGMMNGGFGAGGWPMGNGYYSSHLWAGGITMVLLWIFLALGIAAEVKWLRKK